MGSIPYSQSRESYSATSAISNESNPYAQMAAEGATGPFLECGWAKMALNGTSEIQNSSTTNTAGNSFAVEAYEIVAAAGGTNDTALGTGAREVTVWYMDGNWAIQSKAVAMNGTTPVAVASMLFPIYMEVTKAGAFGANEKELSLDVAGVSTTKRPLYIGGFIGKSENARIAVPAGWQAKISYIGSTVASTTPNFNLTVNTFSGISESAYRPVLNVTGGQLEAGLPWEVVIPEKRLVSFVGSTASSLDVNVFWKVTFEKA